MSGYRFGIGDGVLCNMGPDGLKYVIIDDID